MWTATVMSGQLGVLAGQEINRMNNTQCRRSHVVQRAPE